MTSKARRLYRPGATDNVAVVSVEPATQPQMFMVRVARGEASTAYGPYPEAEVDQAVELAVAGLQQEGFLPGGLAQNLADLTHNDPKVRAAAARRLGRIANGNAVEPLLGALQKAVDDRCAIIDALGSIAQQDPTASWRGALLAALRAESERKLLSRRRSAVEALRRAGDQQGLLPAMQRASDRLPEEVKKAFVLGDASAVTAALNEVPLKKRGLVCDLVYELDDPRCNSAVRTVLGDLRLGQPNIWRYAKSILKRAMLRGDHETFGWLAHRIEAEGRDHLGTKATVKSGYDGVKRSTAIFSRRTQKYLRRAAWRHLRALARYRPSDYAAAAAEAILHYDPADRALPKGHYGTYAACYLLHRVLWGSSKRFDFDARTMKFSFRSSASTKAPAGVREEAFAELWAAAPTAYLRLLAAAKLPEVHAFALEPIRGAFREVLEQADGATVVAMLDAPYEPTVELAVQELRRRFDPSNPDWSLLDRLIAAEAEFVRELGNRWLEQTAPIWTRDLPRVMAVLGAPHGSTRALAATLTIAAAADLDAATREQLATLLLAKLREPEPEAGFFGAYARVAREALTMELAAACSVEQILKIIDEASNTVKGLAGYLLGQKPEALQRLGLPRVVLLAGDGLVAVRAAAHALLRAAAPQLRDDPSVLFALVDNAWADTRQVAFELLRDEVDFARFGLDGVVGLCDSTRVDVQRFGEELVTKYLASLETHDLIYRLAEHPHPNMRRFAVELVVSHLKDGFVPLAKVEPLFRAVLLDLWPSRRDKDRVIDFLTERGLRDEQQAQVAAGILGEFVAAKVQVDFERALSALAVIKLAFPDVEAPVTLAVSAGELA